MFIKLIELISTGSVLLIYHLLRNGSPDAVLIRRNSRRGGNFFCGFAQSTGCAKCCGDIRNSVSGCGSWCGQTVSADADPNRQELVRHGIPGDGSWIARQSYIYCIQDTKVV